MPSLSAESAASSARHAATRHVILGTAGHIDHGKTSLIRALTGTDTDRLPEEKRRGMTIELGFAELPVDDVVFGVVDVPGHEKFVRTMVAGATGVDVALLVVAADDSVMPQTVEHVEILDLLNVRAAVVALTKCDLVDDETAGLVADDVRAVLAATRFAAAPIIRVSSTTGAGFDHLRHALHQAAQHLVRPDPDLPFRMSVDRVFTVAGRGTVVTGSVVSGRLAAGQSVEVWPGAHVARARAVQSHNRDTDRVEAGQRAAVNLQGIDKDQVTRGAELAAPGTLAPTRWLDGELRCLLSHAQPIRNHSLLRLCLGTRETIARCVILEKNAVAPGESALVQLRCREPVVAAHGQRFIVRDENAARTAGGGIVLRAALRRISPRMTHEVAGLHRLGSPSAEDRVEETVRYHGFHAVADGPLALAANIHMRDLPACIAALRRNGRLILFTGADHPISAGFLQAFEQRAAGWLAARHRLHPEEPGELLETFTGYLERRSTPAFARPMLQRMLEAGTVRVVGRYVCLAQFAPQLSAQDQRVLESVLTACHQAGFQPPGIDELAAQTGATRQRIDKLVRGAAALGALVRVDQSIVLHADCEREMRVRLTRLFAADGPFTVSQMRAALDTTRKYAVPFAEYLDRIGFTRRDGDRRTVVERTD